MITALKIKSAFTGQHLAENKFTGNSPIEKMPLPEKIILPLQQHIGSPCELLVKRKDEVLTGQKIAASKGFCSAPIHSSISGNVSKTMSLIGPGNSNVLEAVEITASGEDRWFESSGIPELDHGEDIASTLKAIDALNSEDVIARVKEAGLVGLGGAAFPTFIKLMKPKERTIDTVILNGCECEPYITSDHRVMFEFAREVLLGLYIIRRMHQPKQVFIAIEDNKPDVIELYCDLISKLGLAGVLQVASLRSQYPMGAEKTLIKTILNREVPMLGLPLDVGVVVQNVTTAKSIWETLAFGKPLLERVVTVTGAVKTPKNLLVRIGTPIKDLIEYCGGLTDGVSEIVAGGPMMGVSVTDISYPVTKGTNCILARRADPIKVYECINCGRCVNSCPMRLMPLMFARAVKHRRYEFLRDYAIDDCMECGSCAYGCPGNIPLVEYIKTGKSMLKKIKAVQAKAS